MAHGPLEQGLEVGERRVRRGDAVGKGGEGVEVFEDGQAGERGRFAAAVRGAHVPVLADEELAQQVVHGPAVGRRKGDARAEAGGDRGGQRLVRGGDRDDPQRARLLVQPLVPRAEPRSGAPLGEVGGRDAVGHVDGPLAGHE